MTSNKKAYVKLWLDPAVYYPCVVDKRVLLWGNKNNSFDIIFLPYGSVFCQASRFIFCDQLTLPQVAWL